MKFLPLVHKNLGQSVLNVPQFTVQSFSAE